MTHDTLLRVSHSCRFLRLNKVLIGLFCAVSAAGAVAAESETGLDLKPSEIRGTSSKKPVSVLQNRFFLKSRRPEFGILAGSLLNEAYTDTKSYGARLGLFFNEWVGVEVQYQKTNVADSADRKSLNSMKFHKIPGANDATATNEIVTVDPEVNAVHQIIDGSIIAAPFYGKINLMNKLIVYSDVYLSAGASQVSTDQGGKTAFTYGAGQRFYLYDSWSLRFDFRARSFTEERSGTESRKNMISFDMGASYFFL